MEQKAERRTLEKYSEREKIGTPESVGGFEDR